VADLLLGGARRGHARRAVLDLRTGTVEITKGGRELSDR
jgi:hypothetical protein